MANQDIIKELTQSTIAVAIELQRSLLIYKACEWLKRHNDMCELTEMVNIGEFRKAMEG